MSARQVFTRKKLGIIILVALVCLYVLSILTCTIAFFTPYWLRSVKHGGIRIENGSFRFYQEICHSAGLVSGDCRFPYSDASDFTDYDSELARDMQRTFYCVLGTMCVLYTNLTLTLVAFIADLYENIVYMGFLAVSFGVLYPFGALSVLTASVILEVKYTSDLGFSTILGTISGGLMLIFAYLANGTNMSVQKVFRSKKLGLIIVVTLASLYVTSVLTCTIAFFTPYWLKNVSLGNYYGYGNCQTVGLVSGGCRFPYSNITDKNDELAKDMQRTFYCVLGTMCVLYTNLTLTLVAFLANLYENSAFIGFLSVSFGILYPLGAFSVLTASIILEVKYTSDIGFSTILGTISGGLMLLFYVGLRWHDDQYNKYRLQLFKED